MCAHHARPKPFGGPRTALRGSARTPDGVDDAPRIDVGRSVQDGGGLIDAAIVRRVRAAQVRTFAEGAFVRDDRCASPRPWRASFARETRARRSSRDIAARDSATIRPRDLAKKVAPTRAIGRTTYASTH